MQDTNIEQELESLLNKLTSEIVSDQAQLAVIQKRLESNMKLKHAMQSRLSASNSTGKSSSYGSTWENIRKAVKNIEKPQFIYEDIERELNRMFPDFPINKTRLRTAIWTLQDKQDTIKQVKKGDNRQPAVYALIEQEIKSPTCPPRRNVPPPRKVVME
jgi:hypothetical protein